MPSSYELKKIIIIKKKKQQWKTSTYHAQKSFSVKEDLTPPKTS